MLIDSLALTLATHTSQGWRSIYYLMAGMTFAAVILFVICYHPPKFEQLHTRHTKWQFIKSLDYIGLILFCGGVVPFLFGISWGGQRYRMYGPSRPANQKADDC